MEVRGASAGICSRIVGFSPLAYADKVIMQDMLSGHGRKIRTGIGHECGRKVE